tara:strand:+ start:1466 stop:1963 length:498 start_codon:yes stop_codon:yes gene_type:complete
MGPVRILDTAALISWPLEMIRRGMALESQRTEVSRVAADRLVMLEAAELQWSNPSEDSWQRAKEIAIETGDIAGLSEVDLGLIALAIEFRGEICSDDYRIQNVCEVARLEWSPVSTDGITEPWSWEVRCTACELVHEVPRETMPASERIGECRECGSQLSIKRRM